MPHDNRRHWTPEEKLAILEEARQVGQSVSAVCRKHCLAAGQFYAWEKQAREGAMAALANRKPGRKQGAKAEKNGSQPISACPETTGNTVRQQ